MSYTDEQSQAHFKAREAAERLAHALKQAADKAAELDKLAGRAPAPLKGLEKGLEGRVSTGTTYSEAPADVDDETLERRHDLAESHLNQQKSSLTQARNTLREARKNVAAVAKAAEKLEAWLEACITVAELTLKQHEKELATYTAELERRAAEREAKRHVTVAEFLELFEERDQRQRDFANDRMQAAEAHAKGLPYPYKFDDQGNLRPLAPTFDPKELPPMPRTKGME